MKLFLVVREDLSPGAKAVQACHAMKAYNVTYPEEDRAWYENSNTLALLEAKDETELEDLLAKAKSKGIPAIEFREPDRDDEITAIAIGPSGRKLCSSLPLAFSEGARRRARPQARPSSPGGP